MDAAFLLRVPVVLTSTCRTAMIFWKGVTIEGVQSVVGAQNVYD